MPEGASIPYPLILGGDSANDYNKNQRLQEQLKVADEYGRLNSALIFLSKLPEEKWVISDGKLYPNDPTCWDLEEEYLDELYSKWFFKPVENMQIIFAKFDETKNGRILFVSETGWIFDEIEYSDDQVAGRKLHLNGFKRCDKDNEFRKLFTIPDLHPKGEYDPSERIYSSGKYWRI